MPSARHLDPTYRPDDYLDPACLPMATILGDVRRAAVLEATSEGWAHELPPYYFASRLEDDIQEQLIETAGRQYACGEKLPDFQPREVEIARMAINPKARKIITLRARHRRGRITYRLVCDPRGRFSWPVKHSARPLTLNELIDGISQIQSPWNSRPLLEATWQWVATNNEDVAAAIEYVRLDSTHYPQLNAWYHARALNWAESVLRSSPKFMNRIRVIYTPDLPAIHQAAINGDLSSLESLIKGGSNVNQRLYRRCKRPDYTTVGFNTNIGLRAQLLRRVFGRSPAVLLKGTPLLLAAANGHGQLAQRLIEAGADPGAQDVYGRDPVRVALEYGYLEVAKTIKVCAGASVVVCH